MAHRTARDGYQQLVKRLNRFPQGIPPVEEDFIKALFVNGETQLGRVFVHEPALPSDQSLEVLDHELASEVIKTARHRIARRVDAKEATDLLQQAYERDLVQFGENARRRVSFICNCCGCCCEALLGIKRFGSVFPIHTNFLPRVDEASCSGCGKCVDICPIEAMSLVSANDPQRSKKRKARLAEELCLGCGICVRSCPSRSIALVPHPNRVITPLDSVHRTVLMAIERGKLQNLIFDNHAQWNHRAMAAILGVILKLPPIQKAMACRQMRSRYLEFLIAKMT